MRKAGPPGRGALVSVLATLAAASALRAGFGIAGLVEADDGIMPVLDVLLLAAVVATASIVGVFAAVQLPTLRAVERLRSTAEGAEVFGSAIETYERHTLEAAGILGLRLPVHAAFVVRPGRLEIFSQRGALLGVVDGPAVIFAVGTAQSLTRQVPTLEVTTPGGSLRLYPMDDRVWWRFLRAPRARIERIVEQGNRADERSER